MLGREAHGRFELGVVSVVIRLSLLSMLWLTWLYRARELSHIGDDAV